MSSKDLTDKFELILEKNRLLTFKSWVFDDTQDCSAAKMAEAGFFFTGSEDEPDLVECFLCGKQLDGWLANDSPWKEHVEHSSTCLFANLQQPENALTYHQFTDIKAELLERLFKKCTDSGRNRLVEKQNAIKKGLKNYR